MLPGPGDRLSGAAGLAAFLAAWNNLVNLLPAFQRWYVPANAALAAALLAVARAGGVPWATVGLDPATPGQGLAWGLASAAAVALACAVVLAVPAARRLARDERVAGLSARDLAFLVAVRIPLGTVLLEEIAFRGLLYGLLRPELGVAGAAGASSVVFGLWHVVPSLHLLRLNAGAVTLRTGAVAAAGAVAATTAAGVVLCLLREVSGSLVAPALAHLAANGLAALTGVAAHRLHAGRAC